jgi:hypothetical protein
VKALAPGRTAVRVELTLGQQRELASIMARAARQAPI